MLYRIEKELFLPITLEKAWDFFSTPLNLSKITPPHLNFKIITGGNGEKMYPGQIISYKIHPLLGIPIHWVTEITHVQAPYYFVDEQRIGPYAFWHHQHHLREVEGGVMVRDIVHYKMPFGPFGRLFHYVKVRKDLEAIFDYRKIVLQDLIN